MANVCAWALLILGVVHILFGVLRFRTPLAEACTAGFAGQFGTPEVRRTAFWFLMSGPLLMALGQIAIHSAAASDLWTLRVIGTYLLLSCSVGVAAFPKSPLWVPLLLAPLFIASGYGLFG